MPLLMLQKSNCDKTYTPQVQHKKIYSGSFLYSHQILGSLFLNLEYPFYYQSVLPKLPHSLFLNIFAKAFCQSLWMLSDVFLLSILSQKNLTHYWIMICYESINFYLILPIIQLNAVEWQDYPHPIPTPTHEQHTLVAGVKSSRF